MRKQMYQVQETTHGNLSCISFVEHSGIKAKCVVFSMSLFGASAQIDVFLPVVQGVLLYDGRDSALFGNDDGKVEKGHQRLIWKRNHGAEVAVSKKLHCWGYFRAFC